MHRRDGRLYVSFARYREGCRRHTTGVGPQLVSPVVAAAVVVRHASQTAIPQQDRFSVAIYSTVVLRPVPPGGLFGRFVWGAAVVRSECPIQPHRYLFPRLLVLGEVPRF